MDRRQMTKRDRERVSPRMETAVNPVNLGTVSREPVAEKRR